MDFSKLSCDACDLPFTPEDDVVVCPVCGTPMHRSCWNELGHCVNEHIHAAGYQYELPVNQAAEDRKAAQQAAANQVDQDRAARNPGPFVPTGEYGGFTSYTMGENGMVRPTVRVLDPKEKLGDYTVKDYGDIVVKNKNKYVPKFFIMEDRKSKVRFNWAAFFFPVFWAFYRKMYALGFAIILITSILPLVFAGDVLEYYNVYYGTMYEYMMSSYSVEDEQAAQAAADKANQKLDALENNRAGKALEVNNCISTIISALMALFGNYLYKLHCEKLLAKAKETVAGEEEREKYLKKKGGVSILSILFAVGAQLIVAAIIYFAGGGI